MRFLHARGDIVRARCRIAALSIVLRGIRANDFLARANEADQDRALRFDLVPCSGGPYCSNKMGSSK